MRVERRHIMTYLAITMPPTLSGLIAATFTPFLPNEELNLAIIPQMADLLVRNGVSGAFICGTTGEGFSMTNDERRRTAEAWRAATPPGLKLIVHVGHLSLTESCALARHAQEIGADAIATIAPCFFKPAGAEPANANNSSVDLKVPVLGNYLFSALAGTTWYFQFFFYTMGETQMGKFGFASWTLHLASIIIFSTMWGWIFHEWKGSSKKIHGFIATGIALLILSTVIIGLGTWLRG